MKIKCNRYLTPHCRKDCDLLLRGRDFNLRDNDIRVILIREQGYHFVECRGAHTTIWKHDDFESLLREVLEKETGK